MGPIFTLKEFKSNWDQILNPCPYLNMVKLKNRILALAKTGRYPKVSLFKKLYLLMIPKMLSLSHLPPTQEVKFKEA